MSTRRLFLIILGIIVLAGILRSRESGDFITQPIKAIKNEIKNDEPITIALVGDMMLDRGVAGSVEKNFKGDFNQLFVNVPQLREATIAFANLEGPIAASGKNVGSKYSFRMNPSVVGALQTAGFDVFSFANNHVGDWSIDAFKETLTHLQNAGIYYAGAGENYDAAIRPAIIDVEGKKVGFLGFSDVGPDWIRATWTNPGILLANNPDRNKIIADAKKQVDVLFVSFHWGEEYAPVNERQKTLAHEAIDAGADVVVGHHPHVIQTTEEYSGKIIFYSLGNFIFDQSFSAATMKGQLATITIAKDKTIQYKLQTVDFSKTFQPQAPRAYVREDAVLVAAEPPKPTVPFVCPKPKKTPTDYFLLSLPNATKNLKTYIPENLVKVPNTYTGAKNICITKETYNAYLAMLKAMEQDDVSAHINSGFRDAAEQAKNLEEQGGVIAAAVGQSEHHLGTAIDFTSNTKPVKFEETDEYPWMIKNAWRYGFVQSFIPDLNSPHPGGESWHWRYVGIDIAKKLRNREVSLNDYLLELEVGQN